MTRAFIMDEKLFVELYPRKCQILFDRYHHYKFTNLKCLFQVTVIILRNEQAAQKPVYIVIKIMLLQLYKFQSKYVACKENQVT